MPKSSHIHYYDNVEQGTPEWLELRNAKFTGSNAHLLLTSFGAGSWAQSQDTSWSGNFSTKRGHYLEDKAIELYERVTDSKVKHTGCVTNDDYPNCLYSPDGYQEDRVIEVKCFSPEVHLKTIDAIENYTLHGVKILAQCHFGQMILEKDLTDFLIDFYKAVRVVKLPKV